MHIAPFSLSLLFFLFPLLFTEAIAQTGTAILSDNLYEHSGDAGATAKVSPISVGGQPFTNGYRVVVSGTSAKIEDSRLRWATTQSIGYGDNIQIGFWVRKISPLDGKNLRAIVSFEKVGAPHNRLLFTPLPCDSNEWVKYSFKFKADANYPAGEAQAAFYFAHGPQTFEIGGVNAVNLGPTPAPISAGVPVISNNLFQNYVSYFDPKVGGSVAAVNVAGQAFTQAFQIATNGDSDYIYRSGLIFHNLITIRKGDLMLLTFQVRKLEPVDSSAIKAQAVFEREGGNYEKSVSINFPNNNSEWKQYQIPFKASNDFSPGQARLIFQFGYGPQKFEIGGIKLENYGQDVAPDQLPKAFYYPGRGDANAAWRVAANDRIDLYRKGDLTINVRDRIGNPIPGATVYVQQTGHAFRFGTAAVAQLIAGESGTAVDRATYRSRVSSHFNSAVLENDLKWPFWEDWAVWNRKATLDALAWLSARQMPVRGHCLIWPSYDQMPANTRGLSPAELRSRIDNHFADILKPENAGGKCSQWDVINEPYSNFEVQGRIGGVNEVEPSDGMLGNLEMAKWFHNARRLDPQARLYLNDFDVLEAGGLDVRRQDYLFALANWLLNNGAPLDGIGLQGHFERITPPAVMQSIIERYSQLPLALAITEFDVNLLDEQLQADYTRDVMTLIFSYPKFNDFLLWGFWEKSHWQPHAALYRGDWSSKPNALVFNELVFRDWWSSKSGVTDANGKFALRGFKGTYNVTVVYQRISHTATATIDSSGETAININVITSRNAGRRAATRRIEN